MSKINKDFYTLSISPVKEGSNFYPEYSIILKAVEAVNSFNSLYKTGRKGAKGGPSTHQQQDLYRAMLVFACAGLDAFVKKLVETKLSRLIASDKGASEKFREYVKRGVNRNEKELMNTIAVALTEENPKEVFLNEYIESLSSESLQSTQELCKVSDAAGLNTKSIFNVTRLNALKDAFEVRNQIVHEMDINISGSGARNSGYRTRRQRLSPTMEKHTKNILDLAQELFNACKEKYNQLQIEVEKAVPRK